MRDELAKILTLAAIALVAVAGWAVASVTGLLEGGWRVVIFMLASLALAMDTVDLAVRVWLKRVHGAHQRGPSTDLGLPEISNAERTAALSPYAIVASVYNEADDLDRFLAVLEPFKDVVWLVDDASDDGTLLRLRRDDWKCIAGGVNRKKPGALLHLLRKLPAEIQTVVVMDPDVRWVAPPGTERSVLEEVISDLQRSGAASCTPRIQARRGGWLEECQALEYELACGLGRKSLGELSANSGVSVYRRSAIESALMRHSLSVYAEDFENSLLLLAAGERVYYDDRMIVETWAKKTFRSLFSQRVGWSFGCIKVVFERMALLPTIARRSPLGAYQYIVYLGFNGILLFPLKLASLGILLMSLLNCVDDLFMTQLVPDASWNNPLLFALWYAKSLAILAIACIAALPRGERQRHLAVLPFYAGYVLLQYLPTAVGYLNLLSVRFAGRRVYADHYDANEAGSAKPA